MTAANEMPPPSDEDEDGWECGNPEPVEDEPWVTDPECASCGHKMSCCTDRHRFCQCGDDEANW